MKEFICKKCGGKSYSSVELEYQKNPGCPYCQGKVREVEIRGGIRVVKEAPNG